MGTTHELFTEASELWVLECLGRIYRNKQHGIYNLLDMISHPKHYRAVCNLILYCRGDEADPILGVWFEVLKLATPTTLTNGVKQPENDSLEVLARVVIAALIPVLIHVYVTRIKVNAGEVHPCHVFHSIWYDFNKFQKRPAEPQPFTLPFPPKTFRNSPRGDAASRLVSKTTIQRLIISRTPISKVQTTYDVKTALEQIRIVDSIRKDAKYQNNPVDNTSGLELFLVMVSRLINFDNVDAVIPTSLVQCYQMIPESYNEAKSQVEAAIVYIQRMRKLDLEHRLSRQGLLMDAHTDHQRSQAIREREIKELNRLVVRRDGLKHRQSIVEHDGNGRGGKLTDHDLAALVSRCILFFQEYFGGFLRFCTSKRELGHFFANTKFKWSSLTVASNAMKMWAKLSNCNKSHATARINYSAPLLAFGSFLNLMEALTSLEFVALEPENLFSTFTKRSRWRPRSKSPNVANRVDIFNFKSEAPLPFYRFFTTESLLLSFLRVHATLYKHIYCNLCDCMTEMRRKYTHLSCNWIRSTICHFDDGLNEGVAYIRFLPEYLLYRFSHEILKKCRARATHEMFPKAYWLSQSQGVLLDFKMGPKVGFMNF